MQEEHCLWLPCSRLLDQAPGHRHRSYCSNACKQLAYRQRQEQAKQDQLRKQWAFLPAAAQNILETILAQYGIDAAVLALDAIKASFRNNDNVFNLLRYFRRQS
jgi:hypothetical protein